MAAVENKKKETRFCPYCGMSSFELSGEEEDAVYCEYCGIDVEVKELIP
jgi:NADH pyrophosphatase NudC (nudix superfamily)